MGYIRQHLLSVSGYGDDYIHLIHRKVQGLLEDNGLPGSLVSPVAGPFTNGMLSFVLHPDGSKEFWPTSDKLDAIRDEVFVFIPTLTPLDYGFVDVVEIIVEDEAGPVRVSRAENFAYSPDRGSDGDFPFPMLEDV